MSYNQFKSQDYGLNHRVSYGMVAKPRKGTARHEYFFSWLPLETVVGAKASLVAGFLVAANNLNGDGSMHNQNRDKGPYLVIAILLIIGLVWFIIDNKNSNELAPCSGDYVAQYGSSECEDYQQQQEQQNEYKDCGFRPTC